MRQWPNGVKCVVMFTVDSDATGNEVGKGLDPDGANSLGGYSPKRGIPRFLDIFQHHHIPCTVFVGGYDAEHYPDIVKRIVAEGHEVAAHGYLHESWDVSLEEEDALLRKTHQILTEIAGTPPLGWRSPGGQKSAQTLAVLRELGYLYDSSDKDYRRPLSGSGAGRAHARDGRDPQYHLHARRRLHVRHRHDEHRPRSWISGKRSSTPSITRQAITSSPAIHERVAVPVFRRGPG